MTAAKGKILRMFLLLGIFATAMGILEACVVVYLRELYYPQGFDFPLQAMSPGILPVEVTREMCTMVMLATIAVIAGKNKLQKFAWFLYCFAVWDIFYYAGLKVFLGWPPSWLTWDLLFLIPVAWVGPVLAPVICSITMILLAVCIVVYQEKGCGENLKLPEWVLLGAGASVIFCAFIWDYSRVILREGFVMSGYKPGYFVWPVFLLGELIVLLGITLMIKRLPGPSDTSKNSWYG